MDSEDGLNQQPSSDSFWEVDCFKKTVKRTEDGMAMCYELIKFMQERSEIEKDYSKHLKEFSKKWHGIFEKGPEYGTNREMLSGVLSEADSLADVHTSIKDKLLNIAVVRIKEWRNENYKKSLVGGCKIAKTFEDEFKKAQKPWAKQLSKVNKAKKEYHSACKLEKSAAQQESNSRGLGDTSSDQNSKLREKLEKCQRDMETAKHKYEEALKDLNYLTPRYMEDMAVVFRSTQDFEEKRLQFNKTILRDLAGLLNLSQNEVVPIIYKQMISTVDNSNPTEDLKWWAKTHGVGMTMAWPVFEEFTPETHMIGRKSKSGYVAGSTNGASLTAASTAYGASNSSLTHSGGEDVPQPVVRDSSNLNEYKPAASVRASTISSNAAPPPTRTAPVYDPFSAGAPAAAAATTAAARSYEQQQPQPAARSYEQQPQAAARSIEQVPAVSARQSSMASGRQPPPPAPSAGTEPSAGFQRQLSPPHGRNPFGSDFDDDEFDDDDDDDATHYNQTSAVSHGAVASGSVAAHSSTEHAVEEDDGNPFGPCEEEEEGLKEQTGGNRSEAHDQGSAQDAGLGRDEGPAHGDAQDSGSTQVVGSAASTQGIKVQAMYDYAGIEDDELSFKAGDSFVMLKPEDEQGWCTGMVNGKVGLYPANFAKQF